MFDSRARGHTFRQLAPLCPREPHNPPPLPQKPHVHLAIQFLLQFSNVRLSCGERCRTVLQRYGGLLKLLLQRLRTHV